MDSGGRSWTLPSGSDANLAVRSGSARTGLGGLSASNTYHAQHGFKTRLSTRFPTSEEESLRGSDASQSPGDTRVGEGADRVAADWPENLSVVHAMLLSRSLRKSLRGSCVDSIDVEAILERLTKFAGGPEEFRKVVHAIDRVCLPAVNSPADLTSDLLLAIATTQLPLSEISATNGDILRDAISAGGADHVVQANGCMPTIALALTPAEQQRIDDVDWGALQVEVNSYMPSADGGLRVKVCVTGKAGQMLVTRVVEIVSVESCVATVKAALLGGWRIELRESETDCPLVVACGSAWRPDPSWIEMVVAAFREFSTGTASENALDQFLRVDQLRLLDAWLLAPELANKWDRGSTAPHLVDGLQSSIAHTPSDEELIPVFERRVRSLSTVGSIAASALPLPLTGKELPYARVGEFLEVGDVFVHLDLTRGGRVLIMHWADGSGRAEVEYLTVDAPGDIALHRQCAVLSQVRTNLHALHGAMRTIGRALAGSSLAQTSGLKHVYLRPSASVLAVPVSGVLEAVLGVHVVLSLPLSLGTASGDALDTRISDYLDGPEGWLNRFAIHVFAPECSDLPNVSREAHILSELYPRCLVSEDAQTFLKTDMDVVHFAGHGNGGGFTHENALFFGDTVVTSRDILKGGTRVRTSLAVIDACSGALAEADRVPHDRSLSVADSLLVRGARFVLAPLWSVADTFAPVFCTVFQQAFSESADPYLSLKIAHRLVELNFEADHADPFDFGPFVDTLERIFGGDRNRSWRERAIQAGRTDRFAFQLFERPTRNLQRPVDKVDRIIADSRRYSRYSPSFGNGF